jgi:hypothetical protein
MTAPLPSQTIVLVIIGAVALHHHGRLRVEAHGQQFTGAITEPLPRGFEDVGAVLKPGPVFLAGVGLSDVVERVPLDGAYFASEQCARERSANRSLETRTPKLETAPAARSARRSESRYCSDC